MVDCSQSVSTISRGENGASSKDASQLDSAGEAILRLLHKAAGAAEAHSRQALETAQKLSSQLRAASHRRPTKIRLYERQRPIAVPSPFALGFRQSFRPIRVRISSDKQRLAEKQELF